MKFHSIAAGATLLRASLSAAHAATESFSGSTTTQGHVADKSVYTLTLAGSSLFDVFGGLNFAGSASPAPGHASVVIDLFASGMNLQGIKLVSLASPTTSYAHTGMNSDFNFSGLSAGSYDLQLTYTVPRSSVLGSYGATITTSAAVAAVPEAGSMALALAGLGVVGLISRRRSITA